MHIDLTIQALVTIQINMTALTPPLSTSYSTKNSLNGHVELRCVHVSTVAGRVQPLVQESIPKVFGRTMKLIVALI